MNHAVKEVHAYFRLRLFQGPIQHSFMKDLLANKEGIEVSVETDFGSVKVGNKKILTLWVRNVGTSPRTFERCHMTASSSQMKVQDVKLLTEHGAMKKKENEVVDGKVVIYPTMALYVNISLEARYQIFACNFGHVVVCIAVEVFFF